MEHRAIKINDDDSVEFVNDNAEVPFPIDTTSPDFTAGFEAGLRADDIQKSEEESGEVTPIEIDPDTLSEDERVFYDAGYDAGFDQAVSDQIDENDISFAYEDGYDDGFNAGRKSVPLCY